MLNDKHKQDICIGSGISLENAIKAGYESYDEATVDDGKDARGRALKKYYSGGWRVPITNPLDPGETYYYRLKPDKPLIENKGKKNERAIKYLTPKGQAPHLYFSKLIDWKEVLESNKEVIITEGEKKTDKLIQEGFIAVGVSGVWCWQKDHLPIEDMELLLKKKRRVIICFDADYKENVKVKQALEALYAYILNKGSSPIFACCPGPQKGIDDYIVAKGIDSFNSYLELIRAKHCEKSQAEHEIEQEALEALKSPDLLEGIFQSDLETLGVYGEKENCLAILLAMASHKLNKCVGIIVKGDSSTGKTFIVSTIGDLMPEGSFEPLTGHSTQALSYWTDISHKIIFVSECAPYNEEFSDSDNIWRQLIEENKITRRLPIKDPQTGKMMTVAVTVYGPVVYISTTTASHLNPENENRLLILQTDHDPVHTDFVLQKQREEEALTISEKMALAEKRAHIKLKWQKIIELLPEINIDHVSIPFVKLIRFNTFSSSAMRDQKKLFKMLKLVAWMRSYSSGYDGLWNSSRKSGIPVSDAELQANSPEFGTIPQTGSSVPGNSKRKNVCVSLEDYRITYNMLKTVFDGESGDISQTLHKRWEILNKEFPDSEFKRKDVQKYLNLKYDTAVKLLKTMEEKNMIKEIEGTGKEKKYRCVYYSKSSADFTSPEKLEELLRQRTADKFHYNFEKKDEDTHTFFPSHFSGTELPVSSNIENTAELQANSTNETGKRNFPLEFHNPLCPEEDTSEDFSLEDLNFD